MATCITSQVALSQNREIYSYFIIKEPLAYPASRAVTGGRPNVGSGFPALPFGFTGLPVCRASMLCFPAGFSACGIGRF